MVRFIGKIPFDELNINISQSRVHTYTISLNYKQILQKTINEGYYAYIILNKHAVIIHGMKDNILEIKNSWGPNNDWNDSCEHRIFCKHIKYKDKKNTIFYKEINIDTLIKNKESFNIYFFYPNEFT